MIRSHCIHNCFTAAADNNLNPLLSINNYCNSSKTKHTHTCTHLRPINYALSYPSSPPSLCLHQLEAAAVRPISHRQQAAIGHKRPDGYDVARTASQPDSQTARAALPNRAELFIFIKTLPDSGTKRREIHCKMFQKMLHIKKKPKKKRSMEN